MSGTYTACFSLRLTTDLGQNKLLLLPPPHVVLGCRLGEGRTAAQQHSAMPPIASLGRPARSCDRHTNLNRLQAAGRSKL